MKRFLSIIAMASILVVELNAQNVSFINISPDTQSMGIGGASVAIGANAFAIYNNPAAMAMSDRTVAFAASYGMWQPQYSNNTLIGVSGFGKIGDKFGIGLSGRYFTHQPFNVTTTTGAIMGQFSPVEYAIDLGASYRVIDILSVGANVRYISSRLGESNVAAAIAADIAVMLKLDDISVALAATNLGSKINYGTADYSLSSMIKAGAAYNLRFAQTQRVSLSAEGDYLLKEKGLMAGFGAEYSYNELVMVRLGYHYGDSEKAIPSYASVGLGLQFAGVSVNAAYLLASSGSPLKNTLSFSLGYSF